MLFSDLVDLFFLMSSNLQVGKKMKIDEIILDTLQIYFPWDDDLYTYFKQHGFGKGKGNKKALPLIYTDNCEKTGGVDKQERRFVLHPDYFDRTFEELNWEPGEDRKDRIIIPAEKPRLEIHKISKKNLLRFKIVPSINGKEEYHLEYSSQAAFGKLFTNWVAFYIRIEAFTSLVRKLRNNVQLSVETPDTFTIGGNLNKEERQNQREELYYFELPINDYCFSIGEFTLAREYLKNNGFEGEFPSLVYQADKESHRQKMNPFIKYGVVATGKEEDFWERKPQIVMKTAQPKTTKSERGKKAKQKGAIQFPPTFRNEVIVEEKPFVKQSYMLKKYIDTELSQ